MSGRLIIQVSIFKFMFQILTADSYSFPEGSLYFAHLLGISCVVCEAEHIVPILPNTR